ncbi:MAG: hypothetical protein GY712_04860 [Oceanicoccus sp.]|uniref:hypothetical protein n=1 Tax=Oceanicoccus sp. TaxID=2691044 RepID=UPI002636B37D|nr:hypothetical protein [Oceanicoccus sp.]MCP3907329.1 hypothetical protein [Oceanicoccus sp.]
MAKKIASRAEREKRVEDNYAKLPKKTKKKYFKGTKTAKYGKPAKAKIFQDRKKQEAALGIRRGKK